MTERTDLTRTPPRTARRRAWTSPAAVWATVGVCFLAIQAWIFGRWIADGGLHAVPDGDYTISRSREVVTWFFQAAIAVTAAIIVMKLVRECRRQTAVTLNTALCVGWFLSFWQTPLFNYNYLVFLPNRYAVNVTSWGPYVPGWNPPHPELAVEAIVGTSGVAFVLMMLWYWWPLWLTERISRQWPHWGMSRLFLVALATAVVIDVAIEIAWSGSGLYTYPSGIQWLSLNGGHWYQLPITTVFFIALFLSVPLVMMKLHAQRQRTTVYIFHGTEKVNTRARHWIRILAAVGLCNILMLLNVAANIAFGYIGTGPMPTDTPTFLWPGPLAGE